LIIIEPLNPSALTSNSNTSASFDHIQMPYDHSYLQR
jgi:hypothetical protein